MEKTPAPQVPYSPEHNMLHPGNMIRAVVNGIARLEHWRQEPLHSDEFYEQWDARLAEKRAAVDQRAAVSNKINNLKLAALTDPDRFERPLQEELESYHTGRARALGSYALATETERPRFSGVKRWAAQKRQAYHESRAAKATAKLGELK